MRILVTGGRGKVGRATVDALLAAGHDVTSTDFGAPTFERPDLGEAAYVQTDLTDAGSGLRGRARPRRGDPRGGDPRADPQPGSTWFHKNLMSTFNALEAAVRWQVPALRQRVVRDGAGLVLRRAALPARLPARRRGAPAAPAGPVRHVQGLRRAAHGRGRPPLGHPLHLRAPVVGAVGGQHEHNLGPVVSGGGDEPSDGFWSYVDVYDLAAMLRLAAESDLPGHEVFYAAQPDNSSPGLPLADLVRRHHGDAIELRGLTAPTRRASPPPRPSGCWAGSRRARGATTSTRRALLGRVELPDRDPEHHEAEHEHDRRPRAAPARASPTTSRPGRARRARRR